MFSAYFQKELGRAHARTTMEDALRLAREHVARLEAHLITLGPRPMSAPMVAALEELDAACFEGRAPSARRAGVHAATMRACLRDAVALRWVVEFPGGAVCPGDEARNMAEILEKQKKEKKSEKHY